MAKHAIVLKLDEHLIAKIDKEVAESDGVYTSRSHLLRQLVASYYPAPSRLPAPSPVASAPQLSSIEDALARAEAEYQREHGSPVD